MAITLDGTNGINSSGVIVAPDGSASAPAITNDGDTNTGIFFPAADTIAFAEGGAEAMRIDSSGNVGIGTTSPVDTGGYGRVLDIQSASGAQIVCRDSDDTTKFARFSFDGGATNAVSLDAIGTGTYTVFRTAGTERARIDSSGNLLVGTTAQAGKFTVQQTTAGSWTATASHASASGQALGYLAQITTRAPNDTTSIFYYAADTSAARFVVYSNGGIANYQANNVNLSDRREKTNFAPAKNYLETICSIPVQTFNYIDQSEDDPGLTLGVVAQDVQEVAPELVKESDWSSEKDGSKVRLSIYQTDLQYALMKCIQELSAKNDALEARIAALEGAQA